MALAMMDDNFGYILNKLSSISAERCSSYSYSVKTNFTKYAVEYLVILY